ncbi:TPA: threonine/homoserine exporter RhtA [Enterobacter hormaechei]|jgi:inner membrane transporter RhtA|uniref:Threonine/homoserine exporter RhtA n=2 Tax=Enterobacter hormaechei TaxID=158836 RepID=A0AAE8X9X3_9ENTR|nr:MULTISPECIES: threonine/homoserine exporter RhtA [Enterobacter]ASA02359.1 threonine/homoserine exporter RhtA [Enterobacter cloacae complex sp.]AVU49885.1 threonine/homoserine exporter RhtA [Enterobacter cloacae]ELX7455595.1 threonine/homoserine exporter RhtA [Enterobacter hormaechei subsp. hoffmannii]MBH4410490.1 threonine/homoserine exporter RhtA [Pseudomonas aeruginosa]MBU5665730.1 threonine/homoserine exporter RhtA [Enterobacteriaceae bacterium S32_ASV_15]RYA71432.1 threonine/homoserine
MPGLPRKSSVWMPVAVILIAMMSIQSGASLAKSLFPLVGAPGVTALRIALGTLILVVIFKPWRLRFKKEQRLPLLFYGLALGGMNYMFYLSIQTIPLGIAVALEFTGPLAVALFSSRRPVDFIWVILAVLGLWFLLPLGQSVSQIDLTGAALALGAGACWAVYILTGQRAGEEHGPATVALGSLIAAVIFVPIGMAQATDSIWQWSILPVGLAVAILSTALPYSLEMIALTRLPTRIFGTLMSMEPALAAISGMIFLGETLTLVQTLALCSIIAASMGSTLTMRPEPKVQKIDLN